MATPVTIGSSPAGSWIGRQKQTEFTPKRLTYPGNGAGRIGKRPVLGRGDDYGRRSGAAADGRERGMADEMDIPEAIRSVSLVFSIWFIWYSGNTGRSFWACPTSRCTRHNPAIGHHRHRRRLAVSREEDRCDVSVVSAGSSAGRLRQPRDCNRTAGRLVNDR